MAERGFSILLKFKGTDELQKYIREVYLCNVENAQYELQYIKMEQSETTVNVISERFNRSLKSSKKMCKA